MNRSAMGTGLALRFLSVPFIYGFCLWSGSASRLFAQPPDAFVEFAARDLNRCGSLALRACAGFLSVPATAGQVDGNLPGGGRLTSFRELKMAADSIGMSALAVRWNGEPRLPQGTAAILAVKSGEVPHFIAVCGRRGSRFVVIDFPNAWWIDVSRLRGEYSWNGEALCISSNWLYLSPLYALCYWKPLVLGLLTTLALAQGVRKRAQRHKEIAATNKSDRGGVRATIVCVLALTAGVGAGAGCSNDVVGHVTLEPNNVTVEAIEGGGDEALKRSITIEISNRSSERYSIRKITATCGCTLADEPHKCLIEPGDTLSVPIRLQLPSTGEKRSRVDFTLYGTASGERRLSTQIMLRGRPIHAPTVVDTPPLATINIGPTSKGEGLVHIRTYERSESPNWLGIALPDANALTIDLVNVQQQTTAMPGTVMRTYWYRMQTTDSRQGADAAHNVTVRVRAATEDRTATYFTVRVADWEPMRVVPEMLFAAADEPREMITREIRVFFPDHRFQPRTLDVKCSDSWIKVCSVKLTSGAAREGSAVVECRMHNKAGRSSPSILVFVASDANTTVKKDVPVHMR